MRQATESFISFKQLTCVQSMPVSPNLEPWWNNGTAQAHDTVCDSSPTVNTTGLFNAEPQFCIRHSLNWLWHFYFSLLGLVCFKAVFSCCNHFSCSRWATKSTVHYAKHIYSSEARLRLQQSNQVDIFQSYSLSYFLSDRSQDRNTFWGRNKEANWLLRQSDQFSLRVTWISVRSVTKLSAFKFQLKNVHQKRQLFTYDSLLAWLPNIC